ncbi:hypothetical protein HDU96_007696 [Phlyctochytrium bullatum]|nr:hypothetical protein HDU96_007696 [Phlyctochytrium bullatum]
MRPTTTPLQRPFRPSPPPTSPPVPLPTPPLSPTNALAAASSLFLVAILPLLLLHLALRHHRHRHRQMQQTLAAAAGGTPKSPRIRTDLPDLPRDVVVLHVFERPVMHPGLPNYSPFSLKLETYLRVARIPYVLCTSSGMSSQGKKPYITYNGEEIADSQVCIRWIAQTFKVDLDDVLSPPTKSAAEAFRSMLEDGLGKQNAFWVWRPSNADWIQKSVLTSVPSFLRPLLFSLLLRHPQAYLRLTHTSSLSDAEHDILALTRLRALSTMLGDGETSWFFDTSRPTTLDCAAYATLAQMLLKDLPGAPSPRRLVMRFPNLVRFVWRVTAEYFGEVEGLVDWVALVEEAEMRAEVLGVGVGEGSRKVGKGVLRREEAEEEEGEEDGHDE